MNKTDLSLVSIGDLIEEVENRCETFIASYKLTGAEEKDDIITRYGKGTWQDSIAIASVLNNYVLNNWSGELKTLQRISEDDDEDE